MALILIKLTNMNTNELIALQKKIKVLHFLNVLFLAINIILIVIPFIHYWSVGFKFDTYFIIVTILNIVAFYISYVIANKLTFFKIKHRHFTEKLNQTNK